MNYYNPNFYQQYPYYQQQQMPQNQIQTINGKIVDTIDMVKATDVPIGGYGVFPKADFSEIYIKTWTQNGTTTILSYKPVVQEEQKEETIGLSTLIEKIEQLDKKIDALGGKEYNF